MKLQAREILKNGELGRLFWVTGTFEKPKEGLIYATQKDATEFTNSQALSLFLNFNEKYKFQFVH